jgi:hypothetical protein
MMAQNYGLGSNEKPKIRPKAGNKAYRLPFFALLHNKPLKFFVLILHSSNSHEYLCQYKAVFHHPHTSCFSGLGKFLPGAGKGGYQ